MFLCQIRWPGINTDQEVHIQKAFLFVRVFECEWHQAGVGGRNHNQLAQRSRWCSHSIDTEKHLGEDFTKNKKKCETGCVCIRMNGRVHVRICTARDLLWDAELRYYIYITVCWSWTKHGLSGISFRAPMRTFCQNNPRGCTYRSKQWCWQGRWYCC